MDPKDLNDDQRKTLEQFRINVADLLKPSHDDYYLLRWLKARKFNLAKAEKMLREHMNWRKTYGVDTILQDFKLPEVIQKYTPFANVGYDKDGNTVLVYLTGATDMKGVNYSLTLEDLVKTFAFQFEDALQKMKEENERTGKDGKRFIIIQDLTGLKMMHLLDRRVGRNNVELILTFTRNYPEVLKCAYVLNTPRFYFLWFNIAKTFIDPEILKKIKIYDTEGWKEDLLREIDPNILPAFLGGNLTDPDGNPDCITMFTPERKVPHSYYISNNVDKLAKDSNANNIILRERTYFNYSIEVNEVNSIIRWTFCTIDYDIRFGVYYVPHGVKPMPEISVARISKSFRHKVRRTSRDGHELLLPIQRVESNLFPEEGEMVCEKIGTYLLHFDNTYSWMTPKKLHYKVEVLSPSHSVLPKSRYAYFRKLGIQ